MWVPYWCCILVPCGAVQRIYIVGEEFVGQHVGKIDGTIGPRFSLLNLVHTPLICLDQDRSDVSNSPEYLNVGTVSSVLPLMVIVGGLVIMFRLREISINLHLEELRDVF